MNITPLSERRYGQRTRRKKGSGEQTNREDTRAGTKESFRSPDINRE
ncbi:MAG: hypothetical protein JXA44_08590 [Methanospirillaceae archaeon]|nr:hypothetical protein [Methanospirillaceae archaeon]